MTDRIKKLMVTTPQGESGTLYHDSRYTFNYSTDKRACEASLTMLLRPESYSSDALPIAFAMNRPEGEQLIKILKRFAKRGGLGDMKLLAILGDNQIGRLKYYDPTIPRQASKPPQIGLHEILKTPSTKLLFDFLIDTHLEAGISGVQPKVMIPDADKAILVAGKTTVIQSDLIVKAAGEGYPFLTQNEFLCMEAARLSGICVPDFWLSDDRGLFVTQRFDLQEGMAQGFEDMSVLMNKQPDKEGIFKYQGSYENIATAIQLYCRDAAIENTQQLFEYVALSVMVRNGDAHLKNFGLLYDHPAAEKAPRLAPLYDVVTTTVYPYINTRIGVSQMDRTLALKLNKEKAYPTREILMRFGADACHVAKPQEVIDRIATAMTQTLCNHRDQIDEKFLSMITKEWDTGRMSVEPVRFFISSE